MSIVNSPSRLLVIPEPSTAFHRRSKFSCSANGRPERLQRPLLRSRPSLREPPSFDDSPVLVQSPDAAQEDARPRDVGSTGEEPPSSEEGITIPDHEKQVLELSRPVMKPRNGVVEDSDETRVQSQGLDEVPNGSALLKRPQMKPKMNPEPPTIKDDIIQAMSLLSRPERPKVEFPNSVDSEEALSEEIVQNEDVEETVAQQGEIEAVPEQSEATPPLRPIPPVEQTLIKPKPKPMAPAPSPDSTIIQNMKPSSLQDQDIEFEREATESEESFPVLNRPQIKPPMRPDTPSVNEDDNRQAAFLQSKPELPKVKSPNNITDEGASSESIVENEVLAETVVEEEVIEEVNQPRFATPPLRPTPPVEQTLIKPKPKPMTPTPSVDSIMSQDVRPPSLQNQETEFEKEAMGSKESLPMMERPKRPSMRSPMRPERPVPSKPARPVPPPKGNRLVDFKQQIELVSPKPSTEVQQPASLQKPPVRPIQQESEDADNTSEALATESSSSLKPFEKSSKDTVISPSSELDESSAKLTIDNKASPELDRPVHDDSVVDTVPNLVKPTRPVRPKMPSPEKQDEKQEVIVGRIMKDSTDQSVSKVVDLERPKDESLSAKAPMEAAFSGPELIERETNVDEQKSEQRDPPQKLPEIRRPTPRRPTTRDTNTVSKSSLIDAIEKARIRDPGFRPQDQVKVTGSLDPQLLDSPQIPTRPQRPPTSDPVRPKMDPIRARQSTPETISNELKATLQRSRSAKASASGSQDSPELRFKDPISQQDKVIEGLESPVAKDRATPDLKEKPIKKTDSIDETDTLEIDRQFIREKYAQNAKQLELIRQKKEERQLKAEEEKQRKMEKQGQEISDPILIEMRRKARQERQERRQSQIESNEKELIIEVGTEGMSVSDLAQLLAVDPTEVIKTLFIKGVMVTVNQTLDMDSVKVVANEMEVLVAEKTEGDITEQAKKETDFLIDDEECISRPPVVTVMGHVDHGKTSLLDFIRNSKVASGEAGGITQAIGAYTCSVQTENEDRLICFLDTPGHEAFSAMRARGAKLTDIAIIIIAADDGIQPQTTEAINHAQAAEVPLIIAINKMDAAGADPDRIMRQLSEIELLPEEWGGSTPVVCISAKTGEGVQDLLEMITLVSDIQLDLQANPHTSAKGTVVEAHLDKRAGVVCSLLVQNGALHVGDAVVSGGSYGKVRSLSDERGVQVSEAGPSIAVQMLGFNLLPSAGDIFEVCESESIARTQAQKQAQVLRQQYLAEASGGGSMVTLSSLASADDDEQGLQRFNIILKADTSGSLEAIRGALSKLPQDSVAIRYLHSAAGEVTESDVLLASNAEGVIFGFNVPISEQVSSEAKQRGVQVKGYSVIYHLLDDVRSAMEGKLSPQEDRVWIGKAEVKAVFESGSRRVAGCRVLEGRLETGSFLQVLRKEKVIFEGLLSSLRKVKDSVQEVGVDQECGVGCDEFSEWKEQDLIDCYYLTEKQATLEDSQAAKAIDQDELQELIGF